MSKSILVIDTPSCCGKCPMSVTMACKKRMFSEDCLLKQIPKRKKLGDFVSPLEDMKVVGFNACLEEILNGEQ